MISHHLHQQCFSYSSAVVFLNKPALMSVHFRRSRHLDLRLSCFRAGGCHARSVLTRPLVHALTASIRVSMSPAAALPPAGAWQDCRPQLRPFILTSAGADQRGQVKSQAAGAQTSQSSARN